MTGAGLGQRPHIPHVSSSQHSTWEGCPRKWGYSRRRERTDTPETLFGTRAHEVAENYGKFGIPPDPTTREGACILAGLHLIPLPGQALHEVDFEFLAGGVPYRGRIDMIYGYDPGVVVVIDDHKTTGWLGNAKDERRLEDDPQRVIYSFWALHAYSVEYVAFKLTYYQRKKPAAKPVIYLGHRDEITRAFWARHNRVSLPIVQAHNLPLEALPRNFDHCSAFRGCEFRKECRG